MTIAVVLGSLGTVIGLVRELPQLKEGHLMSFGALPNQNPIERKDNSVTSKT